MNPLPDLRSTDLAPRLRVTWWETCVHPLPGPGGRLAGELGRPGARRASLRALTEVARS